MCGLSSSTTKMTATALRTKTHILQPLVVIYLHVLARHVPYSCVSASSFLITALRFFWEVSAVLTELWSPNEPSRLTPTSDSTKGTIPALELWAWDAAFQVTPPPAASETLHSSAFVLLRSIMISFISSLISNSSTSCAAILSSNPRPRLLKEFLPDFLCSGHQFLISLHGGQKSSFCFTLISSELLAIHCSSFSHDRILPCVCHQMSFLSS